MSIKAKIKKLYLVAKHQNVLFYNGNYIFVISHMRSRSSLLSHILGSNSQIIGYREFHRSYCASKDLLRLRLRLLFDTGEFSGNKYVLDKILNNNCVVCDDILRNEKFKFIFLLRKPDETLKSTLDLGEITGVEWYKDIEQVKDYYIKRMGIMQEYAEKVKGRSFFVDSEEIVSRPENVLNKLSIWLELDEILEKNYQSFSTTGKKDGGGDPSANIHTGTIINTKEKDIELPHDVIEITNQHYSKCKEYLLKNALS